MAAKKITLLVIPLILFFLFFGNAYAYGESTALDDYDNVFTDDEEEKLTELMKRAAESSKCNVGIVVTDNLNGKSSRKYADDYLDGTFGYGSDSIVLLLCNDHINSDWISTYGRATDLFGYDTDRIFDYVYNGLDSDGYFAAAKEFCNYIEQSEIYGYVPEIKRGIAAVQTFLIAGIISLVISFITVFAVRSGYKKKAPVTARKYINTSKTKFLRREDNFVREFTTTHRVSSSSSRSGGGGHRSSGGRGGGGGRVR